MIRKLAVGVRFVILDTLLSDRKTATQEVSGVYSALAGAVKVARAFFSDELLQIIISLLLISDFFFFSERA
jgi:hypothetical protein